MAPTSAVLMSLRGRLIRAHLAMRILRSHLPMATWTSPVTALRYEPNRSCVRRVTRMLASGVEVCV